MVQTKDDDAIEKLLKSDTIWYCGECMSCRPRCPRGNTPGYIIQSLRTLSQKLGFFTESEKGRQQLAIKRTIGQNILTSGYCVKPNFVDPDLHPEQGPVWRWIHDNDKDVFERFGDNYCKVGVGAGRKIDDRSMEEIRSIFEVTGGMRFFENIETCSDKKAKEMGYEKAGDDYFHDVFTTNSGQHSGK